jgi:hypothetical protein
MMNTFTNFAFKIQREIDHQVGQSSCQLFWFPWAHPFSLSSTNTYLTDVAHPTFWGVTWKTHKYLAICARGAISTSNNRLIKPCPNPPSFLVAGNQSPTFFLRICTHTRTITIISNLYPPMPTHSMTCAHPCSSNCAHVLKKLCNVHYPPTPSLGWIVQIKGRSLSLASARSARVFLASKKFDSDLELRCTKSMPTHEQ